MQPQVADMQGELEQAQEAHDSRDEHNRSKIEAKAETASMDLAMQQRVIDMQTELEQARRARLHRG